MFDIFVQSTQLTVFATLLAVGLVYLLASLAVGAFGDSDGDGGDHADGNDTTSDGDNSGSAISMFSPRVIAVFLVGFGAGGAIATANEMSAVMSTLVAIGSGFAIGSGGMVVMKMIYGQQASSDVRTSDAVGLHGTVTVDVANTECGTVDVSVKGHVLTLTAYAADPAMAYRKGQRVRIAAVEGSVAYISL